MAIDIQLVSISDNKVIPCTATNFSILSGNSVLAQRIIKLLLTNLGSDFFNLNLGSKFLSLYGNYSSNKIDQIKSIITILVKTLKEQIVANQNEDALNGIIYEPSELLEDLIIDNIEFDRNYSGWILTLKVISKQGDLITIQIP